MSNESKTPRTDEEINAAIAKIREYERGTERVKKARGNRYAHSTYDGVWLSPDGNITQSIPNYCGDLNAMHEAFLSLDETDRGKFWLALFGIVTGFERNEFDFENEYSCADVANSIARQRAEAFLAVMGEPK